MTVVPDVWAQRVELLLPDGYELVDNVDNARVGDEVFWSGSWRSIVAVVPNPAYDAKAAYHVGQTGGPGDGKLLRNFIFFAVEEQQAYEKGPLRVAMSRRGLRPDDYPAVMGGSVRDVCVRDVKVRRRIKRDDPWSFGPEGETRGYMEREGGGGMRWI